ncbi:MAG: asparagine synthase (glutamine-hydrolyzing) [Acetobacterales bacterium]
MCGIAGYVASGPLPGSRVTATLGLMGRRGPDHRAHRTWTHAGENVGLLHSRLSIIDLDDHANQPFTIGPATVVFNGEIYNYLELRAELEAAGVRFRTRSDTEVLLAAWLHWGDAFHDRLEGMWAFALWDEAQGRLLLSRDRFGEKPLCWMQTAEGLFFGSEPKLLRSLSGRALEPDRDHLCRYLVNGYKSLYKTDRTFFEDVRDVPPGGTLALSSGSGEGPTHGRHWTFRPPPPDDSMTEADAVDGVRQRLIDSVRLRLRADVPIAFCLSGGVDSAALASIASKTLGYDVMTFSILDDDPRYDERGNIQATIDDLGCRHQLIRVSHDGALDRLARQVAYHDAPVATISYYVHEMLSEAISRNGFRVAVSGTAADELFTGYYDHFLLHLHEVRDSDVYADRLRDWETHLKPITRNPHLRDAELYRRDPGFRDHIYLNNDAFASMLVGDFHEDFAERHYSPSLLRNRMANELFHESTPVILREDDLNSMYHSVENRTPFLDRELLDFACRIPPRLLVRDGRAKHVLREAVAGILNDRVRLDRQKKGFNAAIRSIVDLGDAGTRERLLADGPIFDIVDRERITALFDMDEIPNSYSKFLFSFISARLFLDANAGAS